MYRYRAVHFVIAFFSTYRAEVAHRHTPPLDASLVSGAATRRKETFTLPLAYPDVANQAIDASLVIPFMIGGRGVHTHTACLKCHITGEYYPNGGAKNEPMSRKKKEGRLLALRQNQVVTDHRYFVVVLHGACHVNGNRIDEDVVAVDPVAVLTEATAAAQAQQG